MHRVEALVSQLSPSGVAAAKKPSGELVTTIVQQGVAVLSINYPPVNAFNIHVRDAISKAYDAAVANDEVKAIVITGNKTTFMAGADLEYIQAMQNDSSVKTSDILRFVHQSHDLFNKIESGPKPTVAAINGTALGGGLELAMACNARVAVDKAVMGLPELQLGLLPGAGGTQRLPRLIGVQQAVQSTLASRNINAKNALKFGLVDAVVKPAELLQTAGKFALGMVMGKVPRRQSLLLEDKLGEKEDALRIVAGARLQSAGKAKNVPHPFSYLDAVEEGIKNGPKAGIKKEAEGFANLVLTPTAKSLIHFFFASRATSKIPGIPEKPKSPPAKTIAILGAGTMGAGIAIAYLFRGFNVIVKEINQKFLEAGVERIIDNLQRVIKARKLPTLAIEQIMRGLTPQITYDGFDKVDIVIEAALENIPLKQKIFAELESVCSPNAILATNTSTIDVELIGAKTKALDRIVGLHFFSPAHVMPLLEIVRTKHTSNETIARCLQMSKAIGKTPVVSGNCVGFIANRIFFSYGQAAGFLVDAGVDPYRIDKALQSFGMPMGCFRMADLSGIDIFMHVNEIINSAYGQRCYNGTLGAKLSAAKRLGEKTKQGYYKYVNSKPVPDPKGLEPLLAAARADAAKNNVPRIDPSSLTDQQIVEIILFPVVNECTRVVGEGFARTPADVDICAVMGYGFPAYRGGLMFWGASKHKYPGGSGGYKYIRERLAQFSAQYGASNASLKSFFKPSEYLEELAKKSS